MIYRTVNTFILPIYEVLEPIQVSVDRFMATGITIDTVCSYSFVAWVEFRYSESQWWLSKPFDPTDVIAEGLYDDFNELYGGILPAEIEAIIPDIVQVALRVYFYILHWTSVYFNATPQLMLEYVEANDYDLIIKSVR